MFSKYTIQIISNHIIIINDPQKLPNYGNLCDMIWTAVPLVSITNTNVACWQHVWYDICASDAHK